jgi:hypothetical protein
MGFREGASIKGASNLCDILEIITRSVFQGNNTELYPLEVLFNLMGQSAGGRLKFRIGRVVGPGALRER